MLRNLVDVLRSGQGTGAMMQVVAIVLGAMMMVFVTLPLHEWAHAFSAHKLGDDTAKWNGRLTLNPLKHLDLFGTAMLLICGVGYAKPVPINPYNFRNRKVGMALSALAGPLMNVLLAVAAVGLYRVYDVTLGAHADFQVTFIVWSVLIGLFAPINIMLAIFNLIPIPPLDGSRVLALVVPDRIMDTLERYEMYLSIGVMALVLTGVLDPFFNTVLGGFGNVLGTVFGDPLVFFRP